MSRHQVVLATTKFGMVARLGGGPTQRRATKILTFVSSDDIAMIFKLRR
jgi:hypothetical protein